MTERVRQSRVTIRQATDGDFEAVRNLFREGDEYHRKLNLSVLRSDYVPYSESDLQRALLASNATVLLANVGVTPCGVLRASLVDVDQGRLLAQRRYAMVHELVVIEYFRRHGVGHALIEKAKDWARNEGVTSLELSVFGKNVDALRFYEQKDFSVQQMRLSTEL